MTEKDLSHLPIDWGTKMGKMKHTRDFLFLHGKTIVYYINHEEYEYKSMHYFCGWQSPCKRTHSKGKWVVYNIKPIEHKENEDE